MHEQEIVVNIQHFFESILPSALSSYDWDEKKIINAFNWATFCEEVYKNIKDEKIRNEFDEILHTMGESIKDVRNLPLCLEDLKHSSLLLHQAFLSNSRVNNEDLKKLSINTPITDNDNNKIFALDLLCIELIDALKPISIYDSKKSFYYEVKLELFLDFLINTTQYISNEDQLETYLSGVFEDQCKNEEQMTLLFHFLSHDCKKLVDERAQELQDFAFNWVLLKIISDKQGILHQFLWKQSSCLWRAIAENSATFYSFYINLLSEQANSLIIQNNYRTHVWVKRSAVENEIILSYEEILSHFSCLLQGNDELVKLTEKNIAGQVQIIGPSVWNDIYSACMKS